jgi:hypothetical protein
MKNAITVIAFVVMNGAAFLGYRATAAPSRDTDEKAAPSASRAPSRNEHVEPAARTDTRELAPPIEPPAAAIEAPAIADRDQQEPEPDVIAPADVDEADDSSGDVAKASPGDSSQGSRKRSRADTRRTPRSRDGGETRGAVETAAPPRTTPPPAQASTPPTAAAADDKKRLLDEMESNPYKRSD